MDVPKSFNIYFTPRNSWQGIVTNYRTLPEPYKVDTFASGFSVTSDKRLILAELENKSDQTSI